jgi:SAM-dependent methyltransferase
MELPDGRFTPGGNHPNVLTTRELLTRVEPVGAKVLDIGTMEAMVPILLSRRGANVTAIDAGDFTHKIEALKSAYGVDFDYHGRVSLPNTKTFLADKTVFEGFLQPENPPRGYDMVVCSGVLYHVFSPLETLGLCRTMLRDGGIMIMETAASNLDEYSQRWNFDGNQWIYPNGTNTWFPTCRLLDHFMRLLRFRILDCVYIPNYNDVVRVAVIAQAVPDLLATPAEVEWFQATTRNFDYDFFCDLEWAQGPAKPIKVTPGEVIKHADIDSVDMHRCVTELPGLHQDPERIKLRLSDQD